MYTVYGLSCPLNNAIRWIGMSSDVKNRFRSHIYSRNDGSKRGEWLQGLKNNGLSPILLIFKESESKEDVLMLESKLIKKYRSANYNVITGDQERSAKQFDVSEELHKPFKVKCILKGESMSSVIMKYMAEYVEKKQ